MKRNATNLRQQSWVDADIQGAMIKRVCIYWVLLVSLMTAPLIVAAAGDAGGSIFDVRVSQVIGQHWWLYLAAFLVLPIILWDALQVSHRISGPAVRIRQQLVRINSGEPFSELKFRRGDFWQDLAWQINQLTKKTLS